MSIQNMQAMVFTQPGTPLQLKTLPVPVPAAGQVLIKVIACGVCRTDLHILDGDLPPVLLPVIPGHEIVGEVVELGEGVTLLKQGDKVGVPWLAHTCGHCKYCMQGQENLCENALFTGYSVNGGYAEYTVAWEAFCLTLPAVYDNAAGAPMLCAGLIGFRSWRMMNEHAQHIGMYGFGAAAHILTQIATFQYKSVYAFTKPGDGAGQQFALEMGATWAGSSLEAPPVKLDAAIIFAPDGSLVPIALSHLDKGGTVVCGGIHMSGIPGFPYSMLWEERVIKSVANLTREDATLFFGIAPLVPVTTSTQLFPLHQANEALENLRAGNIKGAAVLVMP
ncbi:alcohol dehydrogenase, propanol-preferring [Chitinophaga ginsengisegetis]|uniref:Alcohol dehydrogenase, propanol-preferring n=1 Tax=Chitinophaga ginsengisegetis TaxID=393003 RepID=A0A1T5NBU7_9BACT|nr:zinc-dependent alcohol dehydrogenase family protein [Chitinophaga ginsengisegetis]SKC97907.1 alcohol dehydrogenase, propanol-preferring [Chitinophaga ginsengisegetis]